MNADIPRLEFWQDALTVMRQNATTLLELAGEPVTNENLIRAVRDAPWSPEQSLDEEWRARSYCNKCIRAAFLKDRDGGTRLMRYFVEYYATRHSRAQKLIVDTFVIMLGSR